MIPGLWGAPLKAVSAFSPPQATQDFDLFTNTISTQKTEIHHKKNSALFHCPLNLNCFFDYEEGMQYAKENQKPVPVSLEMAPDKKALVVTGPNTGGKTVFLKTAGQLLTLFH